MTSISDEKRFFPGLGFLLPGFFLFLWWYGSRAPLWNAFLLPSPEKVADALSESLRSGEAFRDAVTSLQRILLGVPAAIAVALPLGLALGRSVLCRRLLSSTLELLRHVPPIALLPLLILWLGIGEGPKIWIVALAAFFPVLLNVEEASRRCDRKLLEMGRAFGLSGFGRVRRILLPSIVPQLKVGVRLAFGYAWRALIGAELLGASSGLGSRIREAQMLAQSDKVLAGILLLGILGVGLDLLLQRLTENSVFPSRRTEG